MLFRSAGSLGLGDAGTDFVTTALDTGTYSYGNLGNVGDTDGNDIFLDIPIALVQQWINGGINAGLLIKTDDPGASQFARFASSENLMQAWRPALELTFLSFSADFDNDGDVDGDDLSQWEGDFGVNGLSDADGDGDSDGADFLFWQQQFGSGVSPLASTTTQVPEPASAVLLIASVIVGMFTRIRQIKQPQFCKNILVAYIQSVSVLR